MRQSLILEAHSIYPTFSVGQAKFRGPWGSPKNSALHSLFAARNRRNPPCSRGYLIDTLGLGSSCRPRRGTSIRGSRARDSWRGADARPGAVVRRLLAARRRAARSSCARRSPIASCRSTRRPACCAPRPAFASASSSGCSCRAAGSRPSRRARSSSRWAAWSRPTCTARTTTAMAASAPRAAPADARRATGAIVECCPRPRARSVPRHHRRHGPDRPHPRGRVHAGTRFRRRGSSWRASAIGDIDEFLDGAQAAAATHWPLTMGWIDCLSRGRAHGPRHPHVRPVGHAGRGAAHAAARRRSAWPCPFVLPDFVLNRPVVGRAFNDLLYYWQHLPAGARASCHPETFFYPLDAHPRTGTGCYGRAASRSTSACCPTPPGAAAVRELLEAAHASSAARPSSA